MVDWSAVMFLARSFSDIESSCGQLSWQRPHLPASRLPLESTLVAHHHDFCLQNSVHPSNVLFLYVNGNTHLRPFSGPAHVKHCDFLDIVLIYGTLSFPVVTNTTGDDEDCVEIGGRFID